MQPKRSMTEGKNGIIKRAVKEALDDKKLDDLSSQLNLLSTQVAAGFSAVHTRQDIANGRTNTNEKEIDTVKMQVKNANDWRTWLLPILSSTIVGLVVYLATRHG